MNKPNKPLLSMLFFSGAMLFAILIMQPLQILHFGDQIAVLFPKGEIALKERNLLFIVQALMLLVILPVYILTFIFSWVYRADNPKGKYQPELNDSILAECIWWGLPIVMVVIVSVLTWVKTHELDPFKSLESNKKELNIQVVALQWKWLFIYPEEEIATVNFLQIPKDRPVRFEITADAPMNSLWIPHLGGQIYAMPGMTTILNLVANETGDFAGSSANISGEGFADMHFITRSTQENEYEEWVKKAKQSDLNLTQKDYELLAMPSTIKNPQILQLKDQDLFKRIVHKYMPPHE